MNKVIIIFYVLFLLAGCKNSNKQPERIPVAEVGNNILYYDEMPKLIQKGVNEADSAALISELYKQMGKKTAALAES